MHCVLCLCALLCAPVVCSTGAQEDERLAIEESARQRFKARSKHFASQRREQALSAELRRLHTAAGLEKILIAKETRWARRLPSRTLLSLPG